MQYAMQIQQDPAMAQKVNVLGELDVDIHLEEVVDTPTLQSEQFEQLVKMMPGLFPQGAPPEAMKMLVRASSLRDKDQMLKLFEPEEGQDPAQAAQEAMQAQMAMAQQQAEMEGQIVLQKAQIEAQTDVEVAKIKAATDLAIKQDAAAMDGQIAEAKAQQDARIAAAKMQSEAELAEYKVGLDAKLAEQKAMLDYEIKTRVADRTGETQRAKDAGDKEGAKADAHTAIMSQLADVVAQLAKPKNKIPIRDDKGLIVGIREEAA